MNVILHPKDTSYDSDSDTDSDSDSNSDAYYELTSDSDSDSHHISVKARERAARWHDLSQLVLKHTDRVQLNISLDDGLGKYCAVPEKELRDALQGKVVNIDLAVLGSMYHGVINIEEDLPAILKIMLPLRSIRCKSASFSINGIALPQQPECFAVMASDAPVVDLRGMWRAYREQTNIFASVLRKWNTIKEKAESKKVELRLKDALNSWDQEAFMALRKAEFERIDDVVDKVVKQSREARYRAD